MSGLKTNKGVLLGALETSYGAVTVLTGALNAILIKNVSVTPLDLAAQSRDVVRPYFGTDEDIPTGATVRIDFAVELAGSGAAGTAPKWGFLLEACAMSQTVDAGVDVEYAPISDAIKSAYLVYNLDGSKHGLKGARGSVSLTLNAKGIPELSFSFTGLYEPVTTQAVTGVDYSAFLKPLAVNNDNTPDCTLFGQSVVMNTFSMDVANSVIYNNMVNLENVEINDRNPTGQISFRNVLTTTYDWWAQAKAAATGAFVLRHGSIAGNIIEIEASKVQPTQPTLSDQEGTSMLNFNLKFIPTLGNDEFVIRVK